RLLFAKPELPKHSGRPGLRLGLLPVVRFAGCNSRVGPRQTGAIENRSFSRRSRTGRLSRRRGSSALHFRFHSQSRAWQTTWAYNASRTSEEHARRGFGQTLGGAVESNHSGALSPDGSAKVSHHWNRGCVHGERRLPQDSTRRISGSTADGLDLRRT